MKQGYKKISLGIIPNEWEVVKLKDVCKINQGLQIPISERFTEYSNNRYFYITNEFIKENSKNKYYIENPPQSVICNEENILMTRTGNTGQVVTNVAGVFHNNFFKIDYDKNFILKDFFIYILNTIKIQHKIVSMASGSTILDLKHNDFYNIKIPLPPLKEQIKIAEILSEFDTAINLMSNLISQKTKFKKALMQNLLTAKIRFPNFKDKWQVVRLGEIGKTYNGLNGKNKNDFNIGNSFYIPYKNIFDNFSVNLENLEKVNIIKNEKQNLVKFGDIFFTISSETPNEVGISSVLLDNVKNLYLNSFCFGYRYKFEILNPYYAKYFFRSKIFRQKIIKLAQGSTRFNISKNKVMDFKIKLPNLDEQKKIAEILSSVDDEIEILNKKLENLKELKKGVMQNLLTGKVRVK